MLEINPYRLAGNWSEGFALDIHILSSIPIGESQWGHMQFDNTYSEVGKRINQLKYKKIKSGVNELVETAVNFIEKRNWDIDLIIPVAPSITRNEQPVMLLAEKVGDTLNIPVSTTAIRKVKETTTLKNIPIPQRPGHLAGAYEVLIEETIEQRVLLFDDIYDSGATLRTICDCLIGGQPEKIFVLTFTKTGKR